jgi:hypothetical protein
MKYEGRRVSNFIQHKRFWSTLVLGLILIILDGLVPVGNKPGTLDIIRGYFTKTTPLTVDMMGVPAKLDGLDTKLVLDTASKSSMLFLFYPSAKMDFVGTQRSRIQLGRNVKTIPVNIFVVTKNYAPHNEGGVLGVDFFAGERITVDPRSVILVVNRDPRRPRYYTKPTTISLPYRDWRGVPLVSCFTDDGVKPFVVDTGAWGDFYVPEAVHKRLPAEPRGEGEGRLFRIWLKPGGEYISGWARVHPRARDRYLLGAGFLFRHKLTLDFRDKMLYLEPPG